MKFMVSKNGASYVVLDLKEAIEKYNITVDELMLALETGNELKTKNGDLLLIDEPIDELPPA